MGPGLNDAPAPLDRVLFPHDGVGGDQPGNDAGAAWCGPDYDPTIGASAMVYPSAIIELLGAGFNSDVRLDVSATWLGLRLLSQPLLTRCPANGPRPPCAISAAAGFSLSDGRRIEFLLSANLASVPPLSDGEMVTLHFERPGNSAGSRMVVTNSANELAFAIVADADRGVDRWMVGPFELRRVPESLRCVSGVNPVCQNRVGSYVLEASPATVLEGFAPLRIPPATSAFVMTSEGRYEIVHRKMLRPIGNPCALSSGPESQFEVIRRGD